MTGYRSEKFYKFFKASQICFVYPEKKMKNLGKDKKTRKKADSANTNDI